jgi:sugar-specific transcriptional regulator TrmB
MNDTKLQTDALCADAALIFKRRDKLLRELREVERTLDGKRRDYMAAMRVYGICRNKFEQACISRGFLS